MTCFTTRPLAHPSISLLADFMIVDLEKNLSILKFQNGIGDLLLIPNARPQCTHYLKKFQTLINHTFYRGADGMRIPQKNKLYGIYIMIAFPYEPWALFPITCVQMAMFMIIL